jgi:energy-coupling factor transporter ATP-binding protein EcfA2
MPGVKLKHLKIHQYRNVRPGTELRFDDGVNLVLGQNASGKTTLLSLLSAVSRSTFTELADEPFRLDFTLDCGDETIVAEVCHLRRQSDDRPESVSVPALWDDSYRIGISHRTSHELTTIVSGDALQGELRGSTPLMMEWSFIAAALANRGSRLTALRNTLFVAAQSFRFDESLECFAAATGRPSDLRGPATPPVAYSAWMSRPGFSRTDGAYVPGTFARSLSSSFNVRHEPSLDGGERALGEQIAYVLGARSVAIIANVRERQHTPQQSSFRVDGFTFEITRSDGSTIHHDRLSYGQKRLIAFLYYLAMNPNIVIADELVNGLHHRWIAACMEAIGDRQAFLTSQNPLLFEHVEFASLEQVETRFITCKSELVDGAEQLVWQNMPRDDAERFYRGYQAEIESIGDILINRGLW